MKSVQCVLESEVQSSAPVPATKHAICPMAPGRATSPCRDRDYGGPYEGLCGVYFVRFSGILREIRLPEMLIYRILLHPLMAPLKKVFHLPGQTLASRSPQPPETLPGFLVRSVLLILLFLHGREGCPAFKAALSSCKLPSAKLPLMHEQMLPLEVEPHTTYGALRVHTLMELAPATSQVAPTASE